MPKVSQEFSADTGPYVAALQAAIDKNAAFVSSINDALVKVAELKAALASIPDSKTVLVNVVYKTVGDIPAGLKNSVATQVVNQVQGTEVGSGGVGTEIINQVQGTEVGSGVSAATQFVNQVGGGSGEASAVAGNEAATASYAALSDAMQNTDEHLAALNAAFTDSREVAAAAENEAAANSYAALSDQAQNVDDHLAQMSATFAANREAMESLSAATSNETAAAEAAAAATSTQSLSASELAKNEYLLAMAERMRANTANEATAATEALKDTDVDQSAVTLASIDATLSLARTMGLADEAMKLASGDTRDVAAGIATSTAAVGLATAWWTRWGTVVHWVIAGGAEFLAVAIPAFIALGSAAFVALQGVQNAYERIATIYTVMEALGPALNKTAGDLLGLGHAGQAAQDAMQPQVYEALGGVIAALQTHLGNLATVGSEVITLFDTWLAKFDVELRGAFGDQLNSLIAKAVTDLTEFGQIFANLGRAILNFAGDMPGLAEVLLRVLDILSDGIKIFSEIPGPIITAAMALEEFWRWGGLIIGIFGRLVIAVGGLDILKDVAPWIGDLGSAIRGLAVDADGAKLGFFAFTSGIGELLLTNPVGWFVLAAIAITGFTLWIDKAKSGVDQWIASSTKIIATAPDYAQMNDTIKALGQNTVMSAQAQEVLNTKTSAWSALASGAQENVSALSAQHKQLTADLLTETGDIAYISKEYGVSYTTAIEYATASGVKLTTSLQGNSMAAQTARQMIANMITGYEAMGQAGTQVTADINAVTVANSGQLSSVQKLNSAWSTVIGLASGMQTSFLTFEQGLNTISTDAKVAGASFNGLNSQSLTLRQDFESNITNMASSLGNLNTALSFGGVSWNQYRQAIATEVEEMLHAGDLSQAQVAQLGQIASAAGYTGTSYGALSKWAGQFGGSENQLNNTMGQATIAMSNQNTMAGKLQGTLQTDVVQATANATLSQSGFQGALIKTQAAYEATGASSSSFQKDLLQLDESMREAGVSSAAIVQENNILDGSNNTVSQSVAAQAEKVKNLSTTYTAASTAANSWQDNIKNVMTAIAHYGEVYVDEFRENIVNGWNEISSATVSVWDSIKSFVVGIWGSIVGVVESMGNSFSSWWKSHGQELDEIWQGAWDVIKQYTSQITAGIESIVNAFWSLLTGITRTAWDEIEPIVALGWDLVKSYFEIAQGTISAAWQVFWGFLEMAGKDAFDAIAAVLKVIWDTIVGIFDVALDLLTGHWSEAWDNLLNTGKQDWNAISGFFKQAWNSFASYASTTFHDIGSDIVGGLKNGILSAAASIGSFVNNNLVQPIIHAVKSFFGIASPSTVMAGLGGSLVSGLLKGLEHSPDKLISDVFGSWPTALEALVKKSVINISQLPSKLLNTLKGLGGDVGSFFEDAFKTITGSSVPGQAGTSAQVAGWLQQAMQDTGAPTSWLGALELIVSKESGGNPTIVDPIDVDGENATGLMQMLPSTFAEFATVPGGIDNPVANAAAAIRYIMSEYGSPSNIPGLTSGHYVGYDQGGLLMPGYTLAANLSGKPERVIPADGGEQPEVHVHLHGDMDMPGLWKKLQVQTFRYNSRNGPGGAGVTGSVRPGGGSPSRGGI